MIESKSNNIHCIDPSYLFISNGSTHSYVSFLCLLLNGVIVFAIFKAENLLMATESAFNHTALDYAFQV